MRNIIRKINVPPLRKFILLLSVLSLSLILVFASSWIADSYSSCSAISATADKFSKVEIRDDGTTLVNGKPFFPLGFYHVSWKTTAEERINALRDIADGGFNTVYAAVTKVDDYEEFLDEAERLGVYVLSDQSIGLLNLVNGFKHKSAVLGWSIADDVDNGEYTGDDVLKLHQTAKTSDPNHITYVSGYSKNIGRFANCADAIAIQSYPIRAGTEKELSSTYSKVSLARDAAAKFNRAVYANLQTFSWSFEDKPENRGARAPTFEEVRNMTYQALMAGAKGIIYYTYYDEEWSLREPPDLWAGMQSLVPEIKALSPIVLGGDFKNIDAEQGKVLAGIWVEGDEALAIVINTSYDHKKEVIVKLPISVREVQPMFRDRPDGMTIKDGKLFGSLKPLEVRIYSLRA